MSHILARINAKVNRRLIIIFSRRCPVARGTGGWCSCCSCSPRDSSPCTANADRTPRIDRRSRTNKTSWRSTRLCWGPTGRGRDSHDIIRSGSLQRSSANWSVSYSSSAEFYGKQVTLRFTENKHTTTSILECAIHRSTLSGNNFRNFYIRVSRLFKHVYILSLRDTLFYLSSKFA